MFDKLFGKNKQQNDFMIFSPVEGEVVSLKEVNDPTFAEEMIGKGAAIKPEKGRVVAPYDGTISMIFDTGHAVSITSEQGMELLIHIGLDTVTLKGECFTKCVQSGDKVKKGDVLIEFDKNAIADKGFDTITPIVICNSDDYKNIEALTNKKVKELEEIISVQK